jgi:uncharacterized protein YyaL (SSP411 family)
VGPLAHPGTVALLGVVHRRFLPNKVLVLSESGDEDGESPNPLLEGRYMIDGKPTAYVCENFACQMPVTDPDALEEQLRVTPEEHFVPGHGPRPAQAQRGS